MINNNNNLNNNSKTLEQVLWNCADVLRGKMDANEYKDYVLGLLFYKYLSDRLLNKVAEFLNKEGLTLSEMQKLYEQYYNTDKEFVEELKQEIGYALTPSLTFESLVKDIKTNEFQLSSLVEVFSEIEGFNKSFEGIFRDVDLQSKKLGESENQQNRVISELMTNLDNVNLYEYTTDALGDAYEYMLSKFASETGKKAGEFYTPTAVANLLAQIVMLGKEDVKGLRAYDPTCGSGSLLLDIKKYSNQKDLIDYWGQELNGTTLNLAKMNMFIHNISIEHQHLRRGDTLDADWPQEEDTDFDCVVMNPPYSAKWSAEPGFLNSPRFSKYGVLAPKSKADYAFLLHGLYHLKNKGTMGIVLPHGVLFRGGTEGVIREKLIRNGNIHAIIGLPANLFYNTSIPTIIMVLKNDSAASVNRDILFIDASKDFKKVKNQNVLEPEHIEAILNMYKDRKDVEKKAHLATFEEIESNDFNLNIPRYVDSFEEEEEINITSLANEIIDINSQIKTTTKDILASLKELTSETESGKEDIQKLIDLFSEEN